MDRLPPPYFPSSSSCASPARTGRPFDTTDTNQDDPAAALTTFTNPAHSHSHHRRINIHPPPVPPVRTSSLRGPNSPSSGSGNTARVPSVQVIQPTPTKIKKTRRRSAGGASLNSFSSSEISHGSPKARGVGQGRNSLGTNVDPAEHSPLANRSRPRAMVEEEDESEAERLKAVEEARKIRAREKGKERQRKKRERDRLAKDRLAREARATPSHATALSNASHLPVPSRNPSQTNLTATHPLALSVPSSTSSTYSSLPLSTSYLSLSPGQTYGLSAKSTSVSSRSSPNVLFTPSISTPGIGYPGTSDMGTPALWNIDGSSSSGSVIDNRRGTRTKARASSTGVAVLAPMVTHPRRNGPSPAKRRKSKPEPEEFRAPKDEHPQVGLGVIMGDETWPTERPQRCRTASDSNTLATTSTAPSTTDWPRSPTPPPVPNLPPQYRRPSSEGHFFASSLLSALGSKGNEKLAGAMESMLGLGRVELEEMRGELAGVYDKWKLVKGMRKVSLEDVQQQNELPQVSSPPIPSSPARSVETASFFTPSARRRDFRQPTAQPVYASLDQVPSTPHESPLASQSHHTRTRSLSSASMLAQGLVIKAQNPNPMLLRWPQPQVDPPTGGIEYNMTRVTSDGADSPSLQTPSTGQGGFPSAESMGSTNAAMGNMVHWRSATDPIHGTSYTVPHPQQIEIPTEWGQLPESEPGLDSPLAMTHSKQNDMPPPPQPLQHYHSHQFSTPHHPHARSARGVRQVMQVPFTPPTPLPMRGRSGIGGGGGIPMFYNPSFHPVQGMMPGGLGIGNGNGNDGGQRMVNGNGQGQVNGEMYRGVGGVGGLGGGDGRGYADGAYEEGYGRQQ